MTNKTVPVEPTEEMLKAADDRVASAYNKRFGNYGFLATIYEAMIEAAPAQDGGFDEWIDASLRDIEISCDCGPACCTSVDEDGCCLGCGADPVVLFNEVPARLRAAYEAGQAAQPTNLTEISSQLVHGLPETDPGANSEADKLANSIHSDYPVQPIPSAVHGLLEKYERLFNNGQKTIVLHCVVNQLRESLAENKPSNLRPESYLSTCGGYKIEFRPYAPDAFNVVKAFPDSPDEGIDLGDVRLNRGKKEWEFTATRFGLNLQILGDVLVFMDSLTPPDPSLVRIKENDDDDALKNNGLSK